MIGAHLVPNANQTYDLGATGLAFRDIYMSGTTLYIGGQSISTDGAGLSFNGTNIARTASNLFTVGGTYNGINITAGELIEVILPTDSKKARVTLCGAGGGGGASSSKNALFNGARASFSVHTIPIPVGQVFNLSLGGGGGGATNNIGGFAGAGYGDSGPGIFGGSFDYASGSTGAGGGGGGGGATVFVYTDLKETPQTILCGGGGGGAGKVSDVGADGGAGGGGGGGSGAGTGGINSESQTNPTVGTTVSNYGYMGINGGDPSGGYGGEATPDATVYNLQWIAYQTNLVINTTLPNPLPDGTVFQFVTLPVADYSPIQDESPIALSVLTNYYVLSRISGTELSFSDTYGGSPITFSVGSTAIEPDGSIMFLNTTIGKGGDGYALIEWFY
jgi:hypothetical protein